MAFQFDRRTLKAVDAENGIEISRRPDVFTDLVPEKFFYIYKGPDIRFEFCVVPKMEWRTVLIKGKPTEYELEVATLIVEFSLIAGLEKALRCQNIDNKFYERIKTEVSAGMFVMSTWGGDLLSFVPDFQVIFIPSIPASGSLYPEMRHRGRTTATGSNGS
jgi:hypothetical protein